jgi:hypothetical protein
VFDFPFVASDVDVLPYLQPVNQILDLGFVTCQLFDGLWGVLLGPGKTDEGGEVGRLRSDRGDDVGWECRWGWGS